MPELQRLHAGHAPVVLAFELANRPYFAASVPDRGDAFFDRFTDRFDDCYGLAWTLVHLIETAPEPGPRLNEPGPDDGDWAEVLRARWGGAGTL